ncbi:unnamed protein product [Amoebophrya sp. A25]|nr:unnamed protein product [Amoebophrya sp. A25]|eukprot:GSA25T00014371001.1
MLGVQIDHPNASITAHRADRNLQLNTYGSRSSNPSRLTSSSTETKRSDKMKLNIKAVRSGQINLHSKEVADTSALTVMEFKQEISSIVSLPAENIRLVCEGRVLENQYALSHYNLVDDCTIHCLEYVQQQAPSSASQVLDPNPQSQQEEMMASLMNDPMIESMMSSPEMMQMMIQMNPQLQQMCEQNPDVRRILEDPETMQQSMRAMRNPQLMREMMRNADRGMANLNTIPGGEDALRRLHNEIVDPLTDAMASGREGGASAESAADRYSQNEIPTAPLANPFDQSRNQPAGGAGAGAGRPGAAAPGMGGANPFMGMGMGGGLSGMGGAGTSPFGGLGGGGLFGMPPPPAGGAAPGAPGAGAMPFGNLASLFGSLSGGATSSTASRAPAGDEFKIEFKYQQRRITHICKKSCTVRDLKGELEPLVNFRRVYVRLIKDGTVWDNEKVVSDYLPASSATTDTHTVYVLKNVETGQREVPLLPTSPAGLAGGPFGGALGGSAGGAPGTGGNADLLNLLLGGGAAGGAAGASPFLFPPQQAGVAGLNPFPAGGGGGLGTMAAALGNPRDRFSTQLGQLRAMGFEDEDQCLRILAEVDGDVSRALDRLFGS